MKVKVEITGLTPLLMHRFNEDVFNGKIKDKGLMPEESAELYAYRREDGELYVPGKALYACIVNGGKYHKLGKNKITTNKSTLIPVGIILLTKECLIGTKEYTIDSQSAVNNALGGARIMVHRPCFNEWSIEFILSIDTVEFSEKLVQDIIKDAGKRCGLLSFRPERKGVYGQFEITKWEEVK